MTNKIRVFASVLALTVSLSALSACSSGNNGGNGPGASASNDPGAAVDAKDTITALLPPVSANYQSNFDQMETDFNKLYPNLTLQIEPASWEDITQKLDTQVNAGSPPDIAFIGSDGISKYVEQGMLMDITAEATSDIIGDFDPVPLDYMKNGSGLYGFPAYMSIHALGGNKQFLEEAGIDWKSVQQNGWTYGEFREAIKMGVVSSGGATSRYGFVFATSGVTAKDYLNILIKNAGMPAAFDKDLKYAYTSQNYLGVLKAVRELIDDGSMPKELSSVDAGKRWNMFLTGQTMITGKGLATFENSAKTNNKKIEAADGAVEGSIPVDYVVLPVPTFAGADPVASAAVDGYVTFRGKKEPTEEHKANVAKAAYFLASGKIAATTNTELLVEQITDSGRAAAESLTVERDPDNAAASQRLQSIASPARPDIPAELGAEAIKLEDEVIIPKFQALLADEITPEEMFEALKKAAVEAFGEDGVVTE
ncbi:extracellular solute-binding protein [Paenibacillus sp. IB182493]|uniref:Extracellular solute-binding protein n=1 Tax=Paenibacillus arenilitoris TaxID=2772299 RepID=A0A927CFB6_9BACL|nr:extracellular solute-binding protein [Paenibacillus arenilitoris]MBD2867028.1 extracellular solute-binding protein [Paenibacillus arenilitoris]